jgi:hypothetical protein
VVVRRQQHVVRYTHLWLCHTAGAAAETPEVKQYVSASQLRKVMGITLQCPAFTVSDATRTMSIRLSATVPSFSAGE